MMSPMFSTTFLNFIADINSRRGTSLVQRHDDGAVVYLLSYFFLYFGLQLPGQRRKIDQSFDERAFQKRLLFDHLFDRIRNREHIVIFYVTIPTGSVAAQDASLPGPCLIFHSDPLCCKKNKITR